jgi:hypothetical protein
MDLGRSEIRDPEKTYSGSRIQSQKGPGSESATRRLDSDLDSDLHWIGFSKMPGSGSGSGLT